MKIKWIKDPKTLGLILATVLVACSPERSPVTGWAYNDPTNGGFEKPPYEEQETGPGLVLWITFHDSEIVIFFRHRGSFKGDKSLKLQVETYIIPPMPPMCRECS